MDLQRTTIRLPKDLLMQAQQYALANDTSLQETHIKALTRFFADESLKKVKKLIIKQVDLGRSWDGLTREDIYEQNPD